LEEKDNLEKEALANLAEEIHIEARIEVQADLATEILAEEVAVAAGQKCIRQSATDVSLNVKSLLGQLEINPFSAVIASGRKIVLNGMNLADQANLQFLKKH